MLGGRRFRAVCALSCALVLGAAIGGCGGDDGTSAERATVPTGAATTTTTAEATTTTTEAPRFEALPADPALTPEQQVEAAYLHSWDIYLDAVGRGDTTYLDLAYADRALELVKDDVERFTAVGQRAAGEPDHNFNLAIVGPGTAVLIDSYVNHLTLVDADSGDQLEPDPNETLLYEYTLELVEDRWLVTAIASSS